MRCSFIRLFGETLSLMVYSLFRVFVYSCIRRDFVSNGIFVYSCIRHFVFTIFRLFYYTIIRLFVLSCIRVFGETSSLMVYSLFRVLVISSGFYFAFLKLNKNCIEIPIILLHYYTTNNCFVI